MIEKLKNIITRYNELSTLMSNPEAISDRKLFTSYAKEHSNMESLVNLAKQYIENIKELKENENLLLDNDNDIKELAKEEISILKNNLLEQEVQ